MASLLSKCGTRCPFLFGSSGKAPLGICLRTSSSVLNTMWLTPAWCAHHKPPLLLYISSSVHGYKRVTQLLGSCARGRLVRHNILEDCTSLAASTAFTPHCASASASKPAEK